MLLSVLCKFHVCCQAERAAQKSAAALGEVFNLEDEKVKHFDIIIQSEEMTIFTMVSRYSD